MLFYANIGQNIQTYPSNNKYMTLVQRQHGHFTPKTEQQHK